MALNPRKRLTQHSGQQLSVAPLVEPVALADVRIMLREPNVADNAFIERCIKQARIIFENYTGVCCIDQTWKLILDQWPVTFTLEEDGYYEIPVTYSPISSRNLVLTIPHFPLQEVTEILLYALDDSFSSVTINDFFFVDTVSKPGRLCLKSGKSWPGTSLRYHNGIEITYEAGFGATSEDVPEEIKRAIEQIAAYLYEHRGEGCTPMDAIRKSGALALASDYVKVRL